MPLSFPSLVSHARITPSRAPLATTLGSRRAPCARARCPTKFRYCTAEHVPHSVLTGPHRRHTPRHSHRHTPTDVYPRAWTARLPFSRSRALRPAPSDRITPHALARYRRGASLVLSAQCSVLARSPCTQATSVTRRWGGRTFSATFPPVVRISRLCTSTPSCITHHVGPAGFLSGLSRTHTHTRVPPATL